MIKPVPIPANPPPVLAAFATGIVTGIGMIMGLAAYERKHPDKSVVESGRSV